MQNRPSSFTIVKMLYSLRRGFLPSPSQITFWARSHRRTLSMLTWAAASSPLLIFLSQNTYQLMWITGRSMTPFLNTDFHRTTARDAVLVSLWRPAHDLHRGDVITFYTPHNPERMAVKRVLALEGDVVMARRGSAVAHAAELGMRDAKGGATVVVPQGHIWVEGDNPEGRFSMDSNTFGPIAKSLVTGKVVAGVWPRFAWVRWQDWTKNKRVKENAVVHDAKVVKPGDVEVFK